MMKHKILKKEKEGFIYPYVKVKEDWLVNLNNIADIQNSTKIDNKNYPYEINWTNGRQTQIDESLFNKISKYFK